MEIFSGSIPIDPSYVEGLKKKKADIQAMCSDLAELLVFAVKPEKAARFAYHLEAVLSSDIDGVLANLAKPRPQPNAALLVRQLDDAREQYETVSTGIAELEKEMEKASQSEAGTKAMLKFGLIGLKQLRESVRQQVESLEKIIDSVQKEQEHNEHPS